MPQNIILMCHKKLKMRNFRKKYDQIRTPRAERSGGGQRQKQGRHHRAYTNQTKQTPTKNLTNALRPFFVRTSVLFQNLRSLPRLDLAPFPSPTIPPLTRLRVRSPARLGHTTQRIFILQLTFSKL